MRIAFVVYGQPVSMKNRRQLVTIRRGTDQERQLFVLSEEAKAYEEAVLKQVPPAARQRLQGDVRVDLRMFYRSNLSDMDEALLLDCLQDRWSKPQKNGERILLQHGVYRNDRQVRERHVYHGIDAGNPRVEVIVEPREMQQASMGFDSLWQAEQRSTAAMAATVTGVAEARAMANALMIRRTAPRDPRLDGDHNPLLED